MLKEQVGGSKCPHQRFRPHHNYLSQPILYYYPIACSGNIVMHEQRQSQENYTYLCRILLLI